MAGVAAAITDIAGTAVAVLTETEKEIETDTETKAAEEDTRAAAVGTTAEAGEEGDKRTVPSRCNNKFYCRRRKPSLQGKSNHW